MLMFHYSPQCFVNLGVIRLHLSLDSTLIKVVKHIEIKVYNNTNLIRVNCHIFRVKVMTG